MEDVRGFKVESFISRLSASFVSFLFLPFFFLAHPDIFSRPVRPCLRSFAHCSQNTQATAFIQLLCHCSFVEICYVCFCGFSCVSLTCMLFPHANIFLKSCVHMCVFDSALQLQSMALRELLCAVLCNLCLFNEVSSSPKLFW